MLRAALHPKLLFPTLLALLLAPLCLLAGCTSTGSSDLADLVGGWVLAELPGTDLAAYDAVADRRPDLELTDAGRIAGFAGVNRLTGSFDAGALADGRFETGPIAATLMAGAPPAAQVERAYIDALEAATTARVKGGRLVLSDDAGAVAVFERR